MKEAQVPGLSLAIIENGEIAYSNRFGMTTLSGDGEAISPSTRFIAAKHIYNDLPMDEGFSSLMKSRVFLPMEMARTTLALDEVISGENFARPHSHALEGKSIPIDLYHERFASHLAPAGAVSSTAANMANYALTELDGGLFRSKRILGEEQLVYRRKGKVAFGDKLKYALAWLVGKERGLETVQHNGGTFGFSSELLLFPQLKSGVVILSNRSGGFFLQPIADKILSLWFQTDLKAEESLNTQCTAFDSYFDCVRRHLVELSPDTLRCALGSHSHSELGDFEIAMKGDELFLRKDYREYRLSGYREGDRKEKLIIVDPPFVGFVLEPISAEGVSLRIQRGQEKYDCKKSGEGA